MAPFCPPTSLLTWVPVFSGSALASLWIMRLPPPRPAGMARHPSRLGSRWRVTYARMSVCWLGHDLVLGTLKLILPKMNICYTYIYIYIERETERERERCSPSKHVFPGSCLRKGEEANEEDPGSREPTRVQDRKQRGNQCNQCQNHHNQANLGRDGGSAKEHGKDGTPRLC